MSRQTKRTKRAKDSISNKWSNYSDEWITFVNIQEITTALIPAAIIDSLMNN